MTVSNLQECLDKEGIFHVLPFSLLSADQKKELAKKIRLLAVSSDEILFAQGQTVSAVYIVRSGQIKLSSTAAQGKECVLHIIRPNSFVDIATVFYEGGVPYSAVALTQSSLFLIDKEYFLDILGENLEFTLRCMRILTARQRLFINKLVGSQGRISVSCRVSSWLLHRSRMEGKDVLHLDIGRELMARLLGVTRESLSRELSRLAELGYIVVERRSIALIDKESLEKLARL